MGNEKEREENKNKGVFWRGVMCYNFGKNFVGWCVCVLALKNAVSSDTFIGKASSECRR